MTEPTIYIDWRVSKLTLSQFMEEITKLQIMHHDQEIFIDGDLHAVVGVPRR